MTKYINRIDSNDNKMCMHKTFFDKKNANAKIYSFINDVVYYIVHVDDAAQRV